MSANQELHDPIIDRREETVVTQEPGYATTEHTVVDVAAERRINLYQITRIVWGVLTLLETLLALRFVLKLIGANAASGFGTFIYTLTGFFVMPFSGLFSSWSGGESILEVITLVAMALYALLFWGFAHALTFIMERGGARTVTRSTREQTPGGEGNERTTHTISRK